jgi:hypothetical protein
MGTWSGLNILDNISESLEQIFKVKKTLILGCGSGMAKFGSGIRYKHPGSATLLKS